MEAVILTSLRRISTPKGDVLHCLKSSDLGFAGFGEVYFSQVLQGDIKGWKRHNRMVLNLAVIVGLVRFVAYGDVKAAPMLDVTLGPDSPDTYRRLTVQPGVWLAFRGEADAGSTLVNVASIEHDPSEADTLDLDALRFPN